jgi:hypothetical protein
MGWEKDRAIDMARGECEPLDLTALRILLDRLPGPNQGEFEYRSFSKYNDLQILHACEVALSMHQGTQCDGVVLCDANSFPMVGPVPKEVLDTFNEKGCGSQSWVCPRKPHVWLSKNTWSSKSNKGPDVDAAMKRATRRLLDIERAAHAKTAKELELALLRNESKNREGHMHCGPFEIYLMLGPVPSEKLAQWDDEGCSFKDCRAGTPHFWLPKVPTADELDAYKIWKREKLKS